MKKKIDDLAQAPELYKQFYVPDEENGGYKLGVDIPDEFLTAVATEREKLSEFRTNNRDLNQKIKDKESELSKYSGVDLDKYSKISELIDKMEKEEEKKALEQGNFEDIFNKRTEKLKQAHAEELAKKEAYLKKLDEERTNLSTKLTRFQIDTEIKSAVSKVGKLRDNAEDDVILRARADWSIDENGQPIAKDRSGNILYGVTGGKLTPEEWAKNLMQEKPYFFENARGGNGGTEKLNANGKIQVDKNDPVAMGKFYKEIREGKAELI